jgi:hypothetical protein
MEKINRMGLENKVLLGQIAAKLCVENWDLTDKHAIEILSPCVASTLCIKYYRINKEAIKEECKKLSK